MDEKKLVMSNLKYETRSYVDCLYSLLTTTGLFQMPKYMLSGMTGMLFKFIVHKRLLPSSLDMYDWRWENWASVNILGIYNETYVGSPMDATFPIYQQQMLQKIITSIDSGKAVIGWGSENPRFCLYTGYNQKDKVLFYLDQSNEEEVLLFDNLCYIDEGDWFIQIIGDRLEKDIRDIFRESLEAAVREWYTEYKVMPEYGSGKGAYLNLLEAFQNRDFHIGGAYYILEAELNSKIEIGRYMDTVKNEIPELVAASQKYQMVSEILSPLKSIRLTGVPEKDIQYIPYAAELFGEAMKYEEEAVKEIEKYLHYYLYNKNINPSRLKDLY